MTAIKTPRNDAAFILAGEPVQFDGNVRPSFTKLQLTNSADATRAGLTRWAATPEGQRIIRRFDPKEFRVIVSEDFEEGGAGRAPQPGIATLAAAKDHSKLKTYSLILNPTFGLDRGVVALPGYPTTAADIMAIAWAGEMLHIDFYARGISLPHHGRRDFQQEWRAVADELGFPALVHADERDEPEAGPHARPRVIYW